MSIMVNLTLKAQNYFSFWAQNLLFFKIAAGGLSAALFGKWTMKVGTRRAMTTGGILFGTAFAVTSLGVSMHSLPLLYAGNRKNLID